ncbi:MAG: AAA family ATPase [Candidatus Thorarchaeota archaeon]
MDIEAQVENIVDKENKLRNEAFHLTGEFIEREDRTLDNVYLDNNVSTSIKAAIKILNQKGAKMPGRGMMFIGYPGVGKTMAGKAMMDTMKDSTFIWISSKDFIRMNAVEAISWGFTLSRKLAPSILFMEDIDTWLSKYAVDLMKTEMDGIVENKGVLTILTTNHPKDFPQALIDRPGRFHDVLKFNIPDESIRKEMFKNWLGDKVDNETINSLISETKGYTGAYIKELVDFANIISDELNVDLEYALILSLTKIKEQRALINDIALYGNAILSKSLITKEGRIISNKNLNKIKDAHAALGEIIKLAEKPEDNINNYDPDKNKKEFSFTKDELTKALNLTINNNKDNKNNKEQNNKTTTFDFTLVDLVTALKTSNKDIKDDESIKKDKDSLDLEVIKEMLIENNKSLLTNVVDIVKTTENKFNNSLAKATGRVTM